MILSTRPARPRARPPARPPVTGGANFPLAHRALRAGFALWWLLFCRWTPPPLHRWRVLSLRLFGARVDWTARVYASARIWYPPNLAMGRHAVLGPRARCHCMAAVAIADFATVSQDAELCGGSHDVDDIHDRLITAPIRIGRQAWVAAGAFVGPGVTLGEGAVLGARAVAMRSLPPWTVHAGNPARRLRDRRPFDRALLS